MLYNVHVSTHTTNRTLQKNTVNILLILATIVVWRCNRSPRSPPVCKTTRANPYPRVNNVQRVTVAAVSKYVLITILWSNYVQRGFVLCATRYLDIYTARGSTLSQTCRRCVGMLIKLALLLALSPHRKHLIPLSLALSHIN